MKKTITFRMAAYTDAAGKYQPDAVRSGNEDNFYVDDDLADDRPSCCRPDDLIELGECGMLMAVADGMGGMNAGEVASQIAIDVVRNAFSPGRISKETAQHPDSRRAYMERVIRDADQAIKTDATDNPEHDGMGSTIILAWLVNRELTVSWCGDSRAYRFNPLNGIELLSEDHSYVQDLVRRGVLNYEQTFDHPQGNIVTRSLGDPGKAAKPETRQFEINRGDIILLCSDGLSGVLRDRVTYGPDGQPLPGDNLEDIIAGHTDSMSACREALWQAAERADWYDNVTAILCQIVDGAPAPRQKPRTKAYLVPPQAAGTNVTSIDDDTVHPNPHHRHSKLTSFIGILIALFIGIGVGFFFRPKPQMPTHDKIFTREDTILLEEWKNGQNERIGQIEGGKAALKDSLYSLIEQVSLSDSPLRRDSIASAIEAALSESSTSENLPSGTTDQDSTTDESGTGDKEQNVVGSGNDAQMGDTSTSTSGDQGGDLTSSAPNDNVKNDDKTDKISVAQGREGVTTSGEGGTSKK